MEARSHSLALDRRGFIRRLIAMGKWSAGASALAQLGIKIDVAAGSGGPHLPLRVGGTTTRRGPLAPFGEAARRALILWREQAPIRVELELYDDKGEPEEAAARFVDFAGRVHAAVAPYGSLLTRAVLPICRKEGVPLLIPSAGESDLPLADRAGEPPIGFSLLPENRRSLQAAVAWAKARVARRVALLFRDDPFSRLAAEGARETAQKLGLKIVWDRLYTSAAEIWEIAMLQRGPDPSGGASGSGGSVEEAVDPGIDLLLGGGYQDGAPLSGFLPDAREIAIAFHGKARRMALLVAPTFREFRVILGDRAEGIIGNTHWKPWFTWPGNAAFVSAYRDRWGEEPDAHAAAAYAAGQLVEAAWTAVRPLAPSGQPDLKACRLALRLALAGLETTTVFGPYMVDEGGRQQAHAPILLQWNGGRLKPLITPRGAQRTGTKRLPEQSSD